MTHIHLLFLLYTKDVNSNIVPLYFKKVVVFLSTIFCLSKQTIKKPSPLRKDRRRKNLHCDYFPQRSALDPNFKFSINEFIRFTFLIGD
jgi:hypothetical protein